VADYPSYFWGGSGQILHIVKDWDGRSLCGKEEEFWQDAIENEDWEGKRFCKTCSQEPSGLATRKGATGRWRSKSLQEAMLALWGRGC